MVVCTNISFHNKTYTPGIFALNSTLTDLFPRPSLQEVIWLMHEATCFRLALVFHEHVKINKSELASQAQNELPYKRLYKWPMKFHYLKDNNGFASKCILWNYKFTVIFC